MSVSTLFANENSLESLIAQGAYTKALDEIDRLELSGSLTDSKDMLLKGVVLVGVGKLDEALDLFQTMLEKYPDDAAILNNMGVIYAEKGEIGNARAAFEQALLFNPGFQDPLYNLAMVYGVLGCEQQAVGDGSQCLESVKSPPLASGDPQSEDKGTAAEELSEIKQTMESWRERWSARDLNGYFLHYSKLFSPEKGNFAEWMKSRKIILQKAERIEVTLEKFQFFLGNGQASVRFKQHYEASNFNDVVVKQLILNKEPDGWKIVREVVL
ncbi:MAG: tetratricopeptide repeat protein [Gammaproteobacteria bacterium]|nr:tetratricopeptide repeat protein [Gammaproteobacteria bacterium]